MSAKEVQFPLEFLSKFCTVALLLCTDITLCMLCLYVLCAPMMKYEVVLWKNPSIGLGITGGKDGENALHPGDKVGIHQLIIQFRYLFGGFVVQ